MEKLIVLYGLDILLIIILALTVFSSMRKGFLKCFLSLICVVAAIFVAMSFSQPAAEFCYDNVFSSYVVESVENAVDEGLESSQAAETVNQIIDNIPQFLVTHLSGFGIDVNSVSENIASLKLSTHDTAQRISDDIIRPGAVVLLKMLCFILIYLAVRFVLSFITSFVNGIAKLPVLKQVNKWLGAVIGAVKGIAVIFILCTILNGFKTFSDEDQVIAQAIDNSDLCTFVNEIDVSDLSEIDLYSITE